MYTINYPRKRTVARPRFHYAPAQTWKSTIKYNSPAVNVVQKDAEYVLNMAVPGLSKEDLQIRLDRGEMTISVDRVENEKNYTRREFNYEKFTRRFVLPENIMEDKIEASVEHGILTLILPIAPEKAPININIQ